MVTEWREKTTHEQTNKTTAAANYGELEQKLIRVQLLFRFKNNSFISFIE